jgi:hypothetical protein
VTLPLSQTSARPFASSFVLVATRIRYAVCRSPERSFQLNVGALPAASGLTTLSTRRSKAGAEEGAAFTADVSAAVNSTVKKKVSTTRAR